MDLFSQSRCGIQAIVVGVALLFVSPLACGGDGEAARADRPETGDRTAPGSGPISPGGRPNVVLILADDLDRSVFSCSTLDTAWSPEGTRSTNALATTSLCCPSRASIFRGQYAHNTGLVNNLNEKPDESARFFRRSGLEDETLATLLQDGGYETRHEDEVHVEYDSGDREYYDLDRDPYRLVNRPEAAPKAMAQDLEALKGCSGEACRRAEGFRFGSKASGREDPSWRTGLPLAAPHGPGVRGSAHHP